MKKDDKLALKIIKKKFTLEQWESFDNEIKNNSCILLEVSKMLSDMMIYEKKEFANKNPQIIKYLSEYEQESLADKNNFSTLSDNVQSKMIDKNAKLIKFASEKVKKEKIKENPKLLNLLSEQDQSNFITENKFLTPFASEETQIKLTSKDENLLSLCNEKVQLIFLRKNPNYYRNCNHHLQRDLITLNMLDFNTLTTDTLNTYILVKGAFVDIDELVKLKDKITKSSRKDKQAFCDYLNYIIVNLNRQYLI